MKPVLVLAAVGLFIWLGIVGVALLAQTTLSQGRDFRTGTLVTLSFVDPDHGWAVAANCNGPTSAASSACRSVVYATEDGGGAWASIGQVLLTPRRVSFVDRQVGWLAGSIGQQCGADPCQNVIMRTEDGGKTWTRVSTVSAELTDIAAVSSDDFWAVGRACLAGGRCTGALVHTSSAGQLWDNSTLPIVGSDLRTGRLSLTSGWVARADAGNGGASLATTRDAGRTWTIRPTPCGDNGILVDFSTANDGWLTCANTIAPDAGGRATYRTADGGQSWQQAGETDQAPTATASYATSTTLARSIQALPTGNAWIALGSGRLVQAAATATALDLQIDEQPVDVRFIDVQHGWLLGSRSVWRTSDGGASWSRATILTGSSS